MADVVWAAMIDRHREWDFPGTPHANTVEEWARDAFAIYCANVASRLPADGSSDEDRLEREGRGWTAFRAKWRAAFKKWDGNRRGGEEAEGRARRGTAATGRSGGATPLFMPRPYVCREPVRCRAGSGSTART